MTETTSDSFEKVYLDELYWVSKRRGVMRQSNPASAPQVEPQPEPQQIVEETGEPRTQVPPLANHEKVADPDQELGKIISATFVQELQRHSEVAREAFRKIAVDTLTSNALSKTPQDVRQRLADLLKKSLLGPKIIPLNDDEYKELFQIVRGQVAKESWERLETVEQDACRSILKVRFDVKSVEPLSNNERTLVQTIIERIAAASPADLSNAELEILDRLINDRIQSGSKERLWKIGGEALNADLCGLAISGGGIRSATFGLGVLQGLAMTGLLSKFDYLSTVSGGGFIGSWFSAWVKRDGFQEVEKQLLPPIFQEKRSAIVEPEPIRHLRLYSNYLAPRPSVLSFDGWVLIAIYLRNLILNQSILIAGMLTLFAGVRTVIELFPLVHSLNPTHPLYLSALASIAAIPLIWIVIAIIGIRRFAPVDRRGKDDIKLKPKQDDSPLLHFWLLCIVPWFVAAFFASLLFMAPTAPDWVTFSTPAAAKFKFELSIPGLNNLRAAYPFGCNMAFAAVILGTFHAILGGLVFTCRERAMFWGGLTGLIGGGLLFLGMSALLNFGIDQTIPVAILASTGVPYCLGIFVLTNFLMVGFCGDELTELEREWWSSLNSRVMYVSVGWLILFGTSIFGPSVLVAIWDYAAASGEWLPKIITGGVGAGWLGALFGGLRAAKGSGTGSPTQSGILDILARLAPFLFVVTLFLASSFLATWLTYDIYAFFFNGNNNDYFFGQLHYLLWNFNSAKSMVVLDAANSIVVPLGFVALLGATLLLWILMQVLGENVGANTFSLHNLYANRLVRCYLGASKKRRNPNFLVNMDPKDDLELSSLFPGCANRTETQTNDISKYWGPIHIVNGALNQKASAVRKRSVYTDNDAATHEERQAESLQFLERQAESFVFTPLYCGSEATGYCPSHEFAENVKVGTAVSVSGAAVSPSMGYHSSPSVSALLTVFNIRLGAWFGNPKSSVRGKANPGASAGLLVSELTGMTSATSDYVYISDGGHFENMGVYELIRRRCRFIFAVDAGADPKFHENVGRLVRQVRIDFGILIEINMTTVTPSPDGLSQSHIVVGRIQYGDIHQSKTSEQNPLDPTFDYQKNHGIIIWIKNSLTGDEPGDLVNFAAMHPTFPYDTTVDQFFNEPQFESYRALGVHSILNSLIFPGKQILENVELAAGANSGQDGRVFSKYSTRDTFQAVYNHWLSAPTQYVTTYVQHNETYSKIQAALRTDKALAGMAIELYGTEEQKAKQAQKRRSEGRSYSERLMAIEMFTLLESVYLSLNLERNYLHPVHACWLNVFKHWVNSPTLISTWDDSGENKKDGLHREFGPSIGHFVNLIRTPPVNQN